MLLSSFMVIVFRRLINSKDRSVLSFMLDEKDFASIRKSIKRIIILTFSIEAGGAILLFPVFLAFGTRSLYAVFSAVFHSISAFCNAGLNTIDFGAPRNSTLMFMIGMMFIGGASGSTAGGFKVNTLGAV